MCQEESEPDTSPDTPDTNLRKSVIDRYEKHEIIEKYVRYYMCI